MKIKSINYTASLQKRTLICKKDWEYYFDLFFQIFINVVLIFFNIILLKEYDITQKNDKFFIWCYILFTACFNFLLYKKLTERKFTVITTNNTAQTNREHVLRYLSENNIIIQENTHQIITAIDNKGNDGFLSWKINHLIILFNQHEILFTLITERNKMHYPSLMDRYYYKKDFKQLINLKADNKDC